ncbi:MAG TPA: hypothetical protein VF199_12575 [Bacillales bacterium]
MSKNMKIILGLLIGSLVVHLIALMMIYNLQETVNFQASAINNLQRRLNVVGNELGRVNQSLHQMKEQDKWILSKTFTPVEAKSSPEEIHLNLQWVFRKIEKDASVSLYYRSGKGEWRKEKAAYVNGNEYQAPLVLSPDEDYQYKIIAKGSSLVSGKTNYIPGKYYKPMPVVPSSTGYSTGPDGEISNFSVSVRQLEKPVFDFYQVERIEALFYHHNDLLMKKSMTTMPGKSPDEEVEWRARVKNFEKKLTLVKVDVTYKDGRTEQMQIWPRPQHRKKPDY